jgi:hypothetical protein
MACVREQTTQTDRSPLVGEVGANFCNFAMSAKYTSANATAKISMFIPAYNISGQFLFSSIFNNYIFLLQVSLRINLHF